MRLRAYDRLRYRTTLRALRQECAPALPVRVRLLEGPGACFGMTNLSEDRSQFNVTLYKNVRIKKTKRTFETRPITRVELIDALCHEWSHCLAWTEGHSSLEDHDPLWGIAFAKVYQAVCED